MNRYARQLALPDFTDEQQKKLKRTCVAMVGAGGLGAAALPYLAGAGIGNITIYDHDTVDITNLHRQPIFTTAQAGQYKADLARDYLKNLNPEIDVFSCAQKITPENAWEEFTEGTPSLTTRNFDLILDGSDNFETKTLLNFISIKTKTPLISASVDGYNGMAGIFAGYEDAPCYRCLHPEIPLDCGNCAENGILGTVAGLGGLYQAHLALCYLLGNHGIDPGTVLALDFRYMRMQYLRLKKNPDCDYCNDRADKRATPHMTSARPIPLLHPDALENHLIIDVRTHEEVDIDPIPGALHIPLNDIPARYRELPKDRPLAFACASNVRSRRAANFMATMGYKNLFIMNRLTNTP